MIGILLAVIATAVFYLIFAFAKRKENIDEGTKKKLTFSDHATSLFVGLIIGSFFFICSEAGFSIFNPLTVENETTEIIAKVEIVALKDSSSSSGSFFLGCGSVGQDSYYVYYTKTEHGFKQEKIDAESRLHPVYINYISSDESPYIVQYAVVSRETLAKEPNLWLSLSGYFNYKDYSVGDVIKEKIKSPALLNDTYDSFRIEIYIPEGSIKENFEIDME